MKKKKEKERGYKETFGGDGYAYYSDCTDRFTGVCVQIHQNACIKYVQFLIYQLYPNKADMRRYRFLELEKLCIF